MNESPPRPSDSTDNSASHVEWLVRIARERDTVAFEQLFRCFSPMIHRFMLRGGVARDEADELVQETMTRIWLNADRYDAALGAPHTWIYTIARNLRADHLHRSRRRNTLPLDDLYQVRADHRSQEDAIDASLVIDRFAELPPGQIAVLHLGFIGGMSQAEISDHLSVPLGTVKSRTRLAFEKLRRVLGINV